MPYLIKPVNGKYELRLKKTNKLLGTHETKKEAEKQIEAIEINKSGRTNPKLWEDSKKKAIEKMGGFSARAMQLAGLYYRQAGGTYTKSKTQTQKDLTKWTQENWTTSSGKESLESGERYLPSAILQRLTKKEIEATNKAKKEGMKKGIQFVKQPKKIVEKIKKIKNTFLKKK